MKLDIKSIESKLDSSIRKNTISIGWDCAERCTGICVLRSNEKNVEILLTDLITTNPKEDIKNRLDFFVMALDKFKQKLPEKKEWRINVIEQPFLGMNPYGYEVLARFSTAIYLNFKKDVDYQVFLGANSARSKIGFNLNKEIEKQGIKPTKISRGKNKGKDKKIDNKLVIAGYLKRVFDINFAEHDIMDAFVLALAGLSLQNVTFRTDRSIISQAFKLQIKFKCAEINTKARKFNAEEIKKLYELAAMRIWSLKEIIYKLQLK